MRKIFIMMAILLLPVVSFANSSQRLTHRQIQLQQVFTKFYNIGHATKSKLACQTDIYGKNGAYGVILSTAPTKQIADWFAKSLFITCLIGVSDAQTKQNHLTEVLNLVTPWLKPK